MVSCSQGPLVHRVRRFRNLSFYAEIPISGVRVR